MKFTPGMFFRRQIERKTEEIIPEAEEIIGKPPPKYCRACATDTHDHDECPSIIRPQDVWKTWGSSAVFRGETFEDVMQEILRRARNEPR